MCCSHVLITTGPNQSFRFSVKNYPMAAGTIGFSAPLRDWATVMLGQELLVSSTISDYEMIGLSRQANNIIIWFIQAAQIITIIANFNSLMAY